MSRLVKDSENNIARLVSNSSFLPDGWSEIDSEELADAELTFARTKKISQVRSKRDLMMISHDRVYLIALKDAADTTAILADRQILLDLPEAAQLVLDAMTTIEDVEAYDAFADSIEKWTKEGEEDVFVDPADPSWTHVPSVPLLSRSYE